MSKTNEEIGGEPAAAALSIAAVERDCGVPKDTLRVWERRYGFPQPFRGEKGERLYPADQVARLQLIRRLVDAGRRPGHVVPLPLEDLEASVGALPASVSPSPAQDARQVLAALKSHDPVALRELLTGNLIRHGLRGFAMEVAPALAQAVGAAWSRGELEIHHEHLFTDQIKAVMRGAIDTATSARRPGGRPRILLTTFPQEPHALGLLMAEAIFALENCDCISLGVQVPVAGIAVAAHAHDADIVALSFSAFMSRNHARAGLAELREILRRETDIWAGGTCPGLSAGPGQSVLRRLEDIPPAVRAWRELHRATVPAHDAMGGTDTEQQR